MMHKVKNIVDRVLEWVSVILLGLMTVLVTYQVVVRFAGAPNPYTEAISKYMFVWMVLFAGAYVFGLRGHMNIGFIRSKMSAKTATVVEMICEGAIAAFAATVMVYGGYMQSMKQMSQLDAALQIPIGLIYMAVPISGLFIVFYSLCNEVELFQRLKNHD